MGFVPFHWQVPLINVSKNKPLLVGILSDIITTKTHSWELTYRTQQTFSPRDVLSWPHFASQTVIPVSYSRQGIRSSVKATLGFESGQTINCKPVEQLKMSIRWVWSTTHFLHLWMTFKQTLITMATFVGSSESEMLWMQCGVMTVMRGWRNAFSITVVWYIYSVNVVHRNKIFFHK